MGFILCFCCVMDLCSEYDGILLDYSRQLATPDTMAKLFSLAEVNF